MAMLGESQEPERGQAWEFDVTNKPTSVKCPVNGHNVVNPIMRRMPGARCLGPRVPMHRLLRALFPRLICLVLALRSSTQMAWTSS